MKRTERHAIKNEEHTDKEEKSKHMTAPSDLLTTINRVHVQINITVFTTRQSNDSQVQVTSRTT